MYIAKKHGYSLRSLSLTCHGKVSNHVITPLEEVPHLQALVLAAQDGREILVGEPVQRARVLEGLLQTCAGLDVAAQELTASVERLLVWGEVHGWHCLVVGVVVDVLYE